MKKIHLINPCAGHGKATKILDKLRESGTTDEVYVPKSAADFSAYIAKRTAEEPNVHFQVYGGDGTVYDTVNGIMAAERRGNVSFGVTRMGSGNDFARSFTDQDPHPIDLIKFNGRYSANMLNVGFDCSVVIRSHKVKKNPLVSGSMAYILGVVGELIHKKPLITTVRMELADGTVKVLEDHAFLFIAIANGCYCGGGFAGAPAAKLDDGLMDVLLVHDMKRREFIKLVADYRRGTHVDPETEHASKKFEDKIIYEKCRSITIDRVDCICADGEILEDQSLHATIEPTPLIYAPNMSRLPDDVTPEETTDEEYLSL